MRGPEAVPYLLAILELLQEEQGFPHQATLKRPLGAPGPTYQPDPAQLARAEALFRPPASLEGVPLVVDRAAPISRRRARRPAQGEPLAQQLLTGPSQSLACALALTRNDSRCVLWNYDLF